MKLKTPENLTDIQRYDGKILHAVMKYIADNGNGATKQQIQEDLPKTFTFTEADIAEKNTWRQGWHSAMCMIGIEYKKTGYLTYTKNWWELTEKGLMAIKSGMTSDEIRADVINEWRKKSPQPMGTQDDTPVISEEEKDYLTLEAIKERAHSEIRDYIKAMAPGEFEQFVAALFKGMGYHVPYIASKGFDRGVDILLYHDHLGIKKPYVKVQVKHYPDSTVSPDVVRQLAGTISHTNDIGVVVTSGKFTKESILQARDGHYPVRLIDGEELIELWLRHYPQFDEEIKSWLPIEPVYFIKHDEK